jgi:hypothetical protein
MVTPDEFRAQYLASGSADAPLEHERLDLIREVLADGATWAEPPPHVADGLLAALAAESVPAQSAVPERGSRWPLIGAVAGGVVAVVALALSTISVLDQERGTVVAMSGTELEVSASGQAAVRSTDAGWWIHLDVTGLPPAPEGKYYEGWVWSDDGEGVSIGTFHLRGGDAPVVLWSGVPLAEYPSIWVTLEDEDEGPEASELVVMTGRIPEPAEG